MPPSSSALARTRSGALGIAAAALCLAACASLGSTVPPGTLLAGRWTIEQAVSAAAASTVDQAVAAARTKLRRRERERFGIGTRGGGAAGRSPGSTAKGGSLSEAEAAGEFLPPDFSALRTGLLAILVPPARLRLQIEPGAVLLTSGALPAQDYDTGQSFYHSDIYGTGTVDAGWSGAAFIVRTHYGNGATLTENYTVDPHSGTLTLTQQLNDPIVGRIALRSVYRRG